MSAPSEFGAWRGLDEAGRVEWLERARSRFFAEGRTRPACALVTIDGDHFDDFLGFLCAMGEAAAGPGGYFGKSMESFDDCLFGGFGIESPCTITWLHSARSRRMLDSNALVLECARDLRWIDREPEPGAFEEDFRADRFSTAELARQGKRTLFDEIVERIESVPRRHLGRPGWTIELRLE